jgi:hypothetical protein
MPTTLRYFLGWITNSFVSTLALILFVESGNRGCGRSLFIWLVFEVVTRGSLRENWYWGFSLHPEHKEFKKILRRHEEITQANCRTLIGILAKLEEPFFSIRANI